MAEHTIDVNVDTKADEASKELRALAAAARQLNPAIGRVATAFGTMMRASDSFGMSLGKIGAAGGAIAIVKLALDSFTKAIQEAEKAIIDFAKVGEEITNESRGKSTSELPQLYRELDTLKKQLESQNKMVMEAGNAIPTTKGAQVWDWLKGREVATWFGAESSTMNYEDVKKQRDETKQQIAGVEKLISKLEQQKRKEEQEAKQQARGEWKEIEGIIKDGLHSFDSIIEEGDRKVKEYLDDLEEYKDFQSEAPVWLQEELRNAGKANTNNVKRDDWSSFINAMDKIGGYMSGFVSSSGKDTVANELKRQTSKLTEIANNTKNGNTPRYT